MATFSVEGTTELKTILDDLVNIPDSLVENILTSMGTVAMESQKSMGRAMNVYDPEWEGTHVLDSFKLTKVKRKDKTASCFITFKGQRKRGDETTRNAEIAFLNEFGVPKRNIQPLQWIGKANVMNEEKIIDTGLKVWDDYLDSINK